MPEARLTQALIARLRPLAAARSYRREELLFASGDPAEGFFIVESGEVRVYKMDERGREVEITRLGPGEVLGEAVAFAAREFPFYAQSVKESKALYLSKAAVLRRIETDPALARDFIGLLARKCLALNQRIESLGLLTVRQRLAQYLLSQCSGSGRCQLTLSMKKGELAQVLGTVNETLSRTLRQMKDEGTIEVKGRRILIKDCPALRAALA